MSAGDQPPPATRALAWLRAQEMPSGGIRVHSGCENAYAEVSGYLIPTLRDYGEHTLAHRICRWLRSVQTADGAFCDPDEGKPRIFDTAQVLRGLLYEGQRDEPARHAARSAAQWLYQQLQDNGRAGFGERYFGQIPETVHLYTLAPLLAAAEAFSQASWRGAAEAALDYYASHKDLLRPQNLTHFAGYEIEALIELGRTDKARAALREFSGRQASDGSIPAFHGATWVCLPGLAQLALCWLKLGEYAQADAALGWLEARQSESGGFVGSLGAGATYFAGKEICWAAKFYLDAQQWRVMRFMDNLADKFPTSIAADDGRLQAVLDCVSEGSKVLEVGCGGGRFLRATKAARNAHCTGADIAPGLLAILGSGITAVRATMENLPLPAAQFDTVFCVEALEHSPNPQAAVEEMLRVLKPGGQILIIDKQRSGWGRFETPSWERWPERDALLAQLARSCNAVSARAVSYDGKSDGLMQAWRGKKHSAQGALERLLVICEDSFADLADKGFSGDYISRYYNPANAAGEVALLQRSGDDAPWPGLCHKRLAMPQDSALDAWRRAVFTESPNATISDELFLKGYGGLSPAWLASARAFAPKCIRAYAPRYSGWLAVELARALGVPAIVSVHNTRGLAAPALRRADAVMCVSEAVAQACIALGADPARVVTVFNRVDRALFSPEGEAARNAPQGSPKLLCVARDGEQKNLDRLLEACARVRERHPNLVLVHAGASSRDWSRWPFVKHFYSIPNAELPAWLRWCDWFVLPSLWEGFGIVYAEALACGVPCIVANRAPMNEIVRDGVCGLCCDPESVDSIAQTIERAISEPGLRESLAKNARAASEPYDIVKIEQREAALYRWVVSPRKPLVSVVLPTFNRAPLIAAAVRNVLAQDYGNLELIVVNDGSRDNTAEVLAKLERELNDPRLRVITKDNGGLPRALNTGFEVARGEYFTWTSDDNAYRPGAISALVRELELDADAALVFADYRVIASDGKPGASVSTGPVEDLARKNVVGACFMYRREVALKVGTYDHKMELAEDYDYWLRIAKVGKLVHLPRVLYDYGDTPDSLTRLRALEVTQAAGRVIARQPMDERGKQALREHMALLAVEFKERGLALRSLTIALGLIARFPLSKSGYWAAARALTPRSLLRATRKLRGLDGR